MPSIFDFPLTQSKIFFFRKHLQIAKVNLHVTHRSKFPAYELFQTFKELLLITVSKTFVDEDVLVRMTMT